MAGQSLIYHHGEVISDTYLNIQALATANLLKFDTLYRINDNTDAEGGDILLKPIADNKFSRTVDYIPDFDDTKQWFAIYDFDTQAIVELRDDIGNIVIGNSAVNAFIWGDIKIYGNYIENPNSLLITSTGQIYNNRFESGSYITINNDTDGIIYNNVVRQDSTFNATTNGVSYIANNTVSEESNLNANILTGQVYGNIVSNLSSLAVTNTTVNSDIVANSILNSSSVSITESSSAVSNSIFSTTNSTFTNYTGTGNFTQNNIHSGSIAVSNTVDTFIVSNTINNGANLTITATTGVTVRENSLTSLATIAITADSGGNFNYNEASSNTEITISNTGVSFDYSWNSAKDYSTILITDTLSAINYNNFNVGAYFDITDSDALISYNQISGSSVTVVNNILGLGNGSFAGNTVLYSNILLQNNDNTEITENTISGDSLLRVEDSVDSVYRNNALNSHSNLYVPNTTSSDINGNSLDNDSGIVTDGSAITGDILNNAISNDSTLTFTTHAGIFRNNYIRANSTVTGTANSGITHEKCILAAATAYVFTAGVSQNATRVND